MRRRRGWDDATLSGSANIQLSTTQAYAWTWDGGAGVLRDWRLQIRWAKAWDRFDVLMSKP